MFNGQIGWIFSYLFFLCVAKTFKVHEFRLF